MAKKNILIADSDESYLNNFERFLWNNYSEKFFINKCKTTEAVLHFIENAERNVDILLISPKLFTEEMNKHVSVAMILSDGKIPIHLEQYPIINKYQHGDKILQLINKKYVEATPDEFDINELNKLSKVTGIFSPIGGSGKTSIAVFLSSFLAKDKKVLYFPVEQMQLSERFFSGSSKYDMSDFLYHVHQKDKQIVSNLNKMVIHDSNTMVNFLLSPKCYIDINKISGDCWKHFFKTIVSSGLYDRIIIDMHSHLNSEVFEIMDICSHVVVPLLNDKTSLTKINKMIHDLNQIEYEYLINKFIYVLNRNTGAQAPSEINISTALPYDQRLENMEYMNQNMLGSHFGHSIQSLASILENR